MTGSVFQVVTGFVFQVQQFSSANLISLIKTRCDRVIGLDWIGHCDLLGKGLFQCYLNKNICSELVASPFFKLSFSMDVQTTPKAKPDFQVHYQEPSSQLVAWHRLASLDR